jgi:hypothetical protein
VLAGEELPPAARRRGGGGGRGRRLAPTLLSRPARHCGPGPRRQVWWGKALVWWGLGGEGGGVGLVLVLAAPRYEEEEPGRKPKEEEGPRRPRQRPRVEQRGGSLLRPGGAGCYGLIMTD